MTNQSTACATCWMEDMRRDGDGSVMAGEIDCYGHDDDGIPLAPHRRDCPRCGRRMANWSSGGVCEWVCTDCDYRHEERDDE